MSALQPREVYRRLWRYGRPYRRLLALAFSCMTVLGLTTGALAYLAGPALRFLLTGRIDSLGALGTFFPSLHALDREQALWGLPLIIVSIGVVKGIAYLGQFYWMGLYGQRVGLDLRRDLFTKLSTLSPHQLAQARVGDLLNRFTADVSSVETAATYALASYVRDGLQILVLALVAVTSSWKLALALLLLTPIAIFPAARLTRSFMRRSREGLQQMGELSAQVHEGLGGLKTIQAFNAQAAELSRFEGYSQAHRRAMTRAGWTRAAVPAVMEVLGAAAIAGVLSAGALLGAGQSAELVSFLTALILLYQPAKDLGRVSQFAVQAANAGERLFELMAWTHPVADAAGAKPLPALREGVRLEHVRFTYGDRPAIEDLSLELPVGKVTALVGPSGAGKSTLTALLLRFVQPSGGHILIDGTDVSTVTAASVRAQFALVTQEPLLFSMSVLENLRYGRPGATLDEIRAAARIAQADAFIARLPQGYDTLLNERASNLSGGQKQRLCLARALAAQAPVLILDEATSNLDPESERELQAALAQVLPGRTALVIAHRLATITQADRIHVLDAGRVVETGTHAELVDRGGLYARLWALQSSSERAAG